MLVICGCTALIPLAGSLLHLLCYVVCNCELVYALECVKFAGIFILLAMGLETVAVIIFSFCFLAIYHPCKCSYADSLIREHRCLIDLFICCCCPCHRSSNAVSNNEDLVVVVVVDSAEGLSIPNQNIIPAGSPIHRLNGVIIDVEATVSAPDPTQEQNEEDEETCPICLKAKSQVWFRTQCGHEFHHKCLSDWQHNTCPCCREPIWAV